MVGEKIADFVLGKQPLAPLNDAPWMHPNWETEQR
jgi:choline dehydrogenase